MNKKQKPPMSFWGIGPTFGIISIIISGTATVFSYQNTELYHFENPKALTYFVSALLILFGLYLWIGQGRKIQTYIKLGILATKGGYGIVRNPIYSGILFVMTGVFLATESWLMLATVPVNYLILSLLLKREDKVLINTFGKKYFQYKKEVNSLIPKLKSFYTAFFYPLETGKISENLFVVKSYNVNIFIYKTENSYICFDTGYGNKQMLNDFEKLGLSTNDISTVFLTHTDYDHAKGLRLFDHAKLYLGEKEEPLINGKKKRFKLFVKNQRIKREHALLSSNQVVIVDNTKVEAIFTPGHTIGHVAYLIKDKILISGDSVILQNGLIEPMYRFFNMKHRQAKASAKIIAGMDGISLICSSHSGIFNTINYNK